MRVLVIGSGAREHALCVALSSDPAVDRAGLRPGQRRHPRARRAAAGRRRRPRRRRRARRRSGGADLVVVGPEVPLVAGAADAVRDAGIACFGPSARGRPARGQQVLRQARDDRRRRADGAARGRSAARRSWRRRSTRSPRSTGGAPYVVKDDGLAAGKGVLVTADRAAARRARPRGARRRRRGAGRGVPRRPGGVAVRGHRRHDRRPPACPAQDFKRRDDGDGGPNTGGMGAYAPLPWAPPGLVDDVLATVLQPTVDEMAPPRRALQRAALRRAGAHLARRAGGRVQRPLRRPGDRRSCCRCWRRRWPGCCTRPRPARWPTHPPLRWRDGRRGHRRRRRARATRRRRAPATR